jgi:hypothetical protein
MTIRIDLASEDVDEAPLFHARRQGRNGAGVVSGRSEEKKGLWA